MSAAIVYRHQMIRAVLGSVPAMCAEVADSTALDQIAERLVQAEDALSILRAKGYGKVGSTLLDAAKLVPDAPKGK